MNITNGRLQRGLVLDTDVEFDGTFLPTVVDIDGKYTEEEIENIMELAEIDDIFQWRGIEFEESNGLDVYYPIVTECEHETVDHSVWE